MAGPLSFDGDLDVLTSVALKGVLEQVAPEFRRNTGRGLAMGYAPGGIVMQRVRANTACDVAVATPEAIDVLIGEGHVVAGSQRSIARSVIGVAVRAGAARPAIATADELRQALLAARSVAYTDPSTGAASGVHFVQILDRLGITDAIKAKARLGDGGPVAMLVASGQADLAIQQICEHRLVPGVDVVGPLPAGLQKVTTFVAGVCTRAKAPQDAEALIGLLTAPHVLGSMPSHGLEPIQPSR